MSAAPPPGGRGGLGWLILAGVLAVPGLLFYNWWSHLKTERERQVAAKARGRVPEGGVFQSSPASTKLANPLTPAAVPPVAAASTGTPVDAAAQTVVEAAPVAAAPAPADAVAAGMPPVVEAAAVSTASAATEPEGVLVVASTSASIVLPRDPMLSPFDLIRLKEEEAAREAAAAALDPAKNRPKRKPKPKVPTPEKQIELQGIVETADGGNKAIVNGEVLGPGEYLPLSGGRVKIVRIGPDGVTFDFNGRKFKMSVSRE